LPKGEKDERKGVVEKRRTVMETILEHAQVLVYSLISLMPSPYQKASFEAMMGLFLSESGHALPEHTPVKSPSSLSRFLNQYPWSTRSVIRTTRQAIRRQLLRYCPRSDQPLQVLIDLTSLEKCGKFLPLSAAEPWVRWLNEKRGLHVVILYLVMGDWRLPWSFRIWQGKGHPSPSQLACKLLQTMPRWLHQGKPVMVLADTEFGTIDVFTAVHQRSWRAVVGVRHSRKLEDGRSLKQLYRQGKRGQQVYLQGIPFPLTVSWFWLKQQGGQRELRFVVSTYPYSGAYLVRLGRKRWAIEAFFKTIKHRFGWHCFGQQTKIGVYRWLVLALIAYLLAYWTYKSRALERLDWRAVCLLARQLLFPSFLWTKFCASLQEHADLARKLGFEILLKPLTCNASELLLS
jgi:Transposase DDE domain